MSGVDVLGVKDVSEQLQAVDESWAGAGEIGGGVDGDHAVGSAGGEAIGEGHGPLAGSGGVISAGHDDGYVGLGGDDDIPVEGLGWFAGHAENGIAPATLDYRRGPVPR